ncbi:MAG TPA: DoxX family protein [Longimicrobium sp.]|nr:DoxX family protein [Longimicrobium sp.]
MSGRASRLLLAAIFVFSGVMHFVIPASYERIMPPWLPLHRPLVYLSGVLEISGGVGLLIERTRRAAGIGLVLLLIAVWPANLQMLRNAQAADRPAPEQALLWLRLPLQLVLIAWTWRVSRPHGRGPRFRIGGSGSQRPGP